MSSQDYWWCDITYEYLRHVYDAIKHLENYLQSEQFSDGVKAYLKRIRQFCDEIIKEIDKIGETK